MPTASKLVAAVIFAGLGLAAVNTLLPHLAEGTRVGWLRQVAAIIGAVLGWTTIGAAGRLNRYGEAAGAGLRTVVYMVFWTLLLASVYLMIQGSMRGQYPGPVEAVLGVFDIMQAQGRLLLEADVLLVLTLGGLFGGLATEWAARRWT
jgi:hypothetical protein